MQDNWREWFGEVRGSVWLQIWAWLTVGSLAWFLLWLPEWRIVDVVYGYNQQRLNIILILALMVIGVLMTSEGRRLYAGTVLAVPRTVLWWAAGFFCMGTLSALRAASPVHGLLEVSSYALIFFAAFALAAARSVLGRRMDLMLLAGVLALLWLYALQFWSTFLEPWYPTLKFSERAGAAGFVNIRTFGFAAAFLLPLSVLPLLWFPFLPKWLKGLLIVMSASLWTQLLVANSRGSLLALVVVLVLCACCWRGNCAAWLRWQWMAFVCGIFGFGLALWLHGNAAVAVGAAPEAMIRTSSSGRIEMWLLAFEYIRAMPLLGIGPMHWAADMHNRAGSPHNFIVQFGVEWGLVALMFFLLVGFALMRRLVEVNRELSVDDRVWLATAGVVVVDSLFSGSFGSPIGWAVLPLLCAMALHRLCPAREAPVSALSIRWIIGLISLVLCVLAFTLTAEIQRIEESQINFFDGKRLFYAPRFWIQGWF